MTEAREIKFTVPYITPPSVNHIWVHTRSGKHFLTSEAIAFYDAVALFGRGLQIRAKHYQVIATVYLAKGKKGDADNFGKALCDALGKAGIIHTDAAVKDVQITKDRDWKNPRTEYTVREWRKQ